MDISTELKAKLRELRKGKGYTLADLSSICGVAVSTLSSIESGALSSIRDETYQKIIRALDYEVEADAPVFNIGTGHSIWSSPVLLVFRTKNGIKGWKMYSCGSPADGFDPYLIQSEHDIDSGRIPGFGIYNDTDSDDAKPELDSAENLKDISRKKSPKYEPFTGLELVNHLEMGLNEMAIVPRVLFEQTNKTEFISIANLVYSSIGGTILSIFSNKEQLSLEKVTDIDSLEQLLLPTAKDGRISVHVLYPSGTNCEQHYEKLLIPYFKEFKKKNKDYAFQFDAEVIEINETEETADNIINILKNNSHKTVWLLGWQPISGWIERNIRDKRPGYNGALGINTIHFDLIKIMNLRENEPMVNFEFTIFTKKNGPVLDNLEKLNILLEALYVKTKELNREIDYIRFFYKSNKENAKYDDITCTKTVPRIAQYLDMDPDTCARALVGVNFHFTIDPEFYFHLNHKSD